MAEQADTIAPPATGVGRYRWTIVALLLAATTVNYIDRQMLGLLKPDLAVQFGWTENDYGRMVTVFQAAYAFGFLGFGRIVDLLGARVGYTIGIVVWTIGHVAHGFASTVLHFSMARFVLGLGEAANFPAAVRAASEWFPQRERSFAIGIFNAGANLGAILTPGIVWLLIDVAGFDWRMVFIGTGLFGVALAVAWWALYRHPSEHPRVSPSELAWIRQDAPSSAARVPWRRLMRRREAWAFASAKFMTDPGWFFLLFWLPSYFAGEHGLDLKTTILPLMAIYLISDVGSVAGGWASSRLIAKGWTANAARKSVMLACACAVLPMLLLGGSVGVWTAVAIIGLAAAAHQAFSANLLSLPGDMFPQAAVGSVIGLGGFMGGSGGMLMASSAGSVLNATSGDYSLLFASCSAAYFIAVGGVHLLAPRLEPARLG